MDRQPTNRAGGTRRRSYPALVALPAFAAFAALAAAGLLAGCSAAGNGPGFSADPCSLITSAELEATIGGGVSVAGTPASTRESTTNAGCAWMLAAPGDPLGDSVNLTVVSPGGAADFAATRQFLEALEGSPEPGASTGASVVAPVPPSAGSSPAATPDLGISLQTVPGLGDDAFIGSASTVYTIKADTELELQLVAFDDASALQHTIDLLMKALARLP